MADQHSTETAETLTDDMQHVALNATDETPAAKGTTIKHKCNICQTPAKLCCTGYDPTPLADEGASKKTWYCTRYCQMKDRMSHKAYCKGIQAKVDLQSLQRATRVLQALFNLCRHIEAAATISSNHAACQSAALQQHLSPESPGQTLLYTGPNRRTS